MSGETALMVFIDSSHGIWLFLLGESPFSLLLPIVLLISLHD